MCGQGAVEVAVEGLVGAGRTGGAGLDFGEVQGAFESGGGGRGVVLAGF